MLYVYKKTEAEGHWKNIAFSYWQMKFPLGNHDASEPPPRIWPPRPRCKVPFPTKSKPSSGEIAGFWAGFHLQTKHKDNA